MLSRILFKTTYFPNLMLPIASACVSLVSSETLRSMLSISCDDDWVNRLNTESNVSSLFSSEMLKIITFFEGMSSNFYVHTLFPLIKRNICNVVRIIMLIRLWCREKLRRV